MDAATFNHYARTRAGSTDWVNDLTVPIRSCTLKSSNDARSQNESSASETISASKVTRGRTLQHKSFKPRQTTIVEPPPFTDFEMYRLLYTKNLHKEDRPEPTAYTLSTDPVTRAIERVSLDSHLTINCPLAKDKFENATMVYVLVKGEIRAMKVEFIHDLQIMILYRDSQLRVNPYKHFRDCNDTDSMLQHCRQIGVVSDMLDMSTKHYCMLYWTFTRTPQLILFPDEDTKEEFIVLCQHIIEYVRNETIESEGEGEVDEDIETLPLQFRDRARSFSKLMSENEFPSADEDSDHDDIISARSSSPSRSMTIAKTFKSVGSIAPMFGFAGTMLEYDEIGRPVTRLDPNCYSNQEKLQNRYLTRRNCAVEFDIHSVIEKELAERSAIRFVDVTCRTDLPYYCKAIINKCLCDVMIRPNLAKMQLNLTDTHGTMSYIHLQWVEKIQKNIDIDSLMEMVAQEGEDNLGIRLHSLDQNTGSFRYPLKLDLPRKNKTYVILFNDYNMPVDVANFILHMQHIFRVNRADVNFNVSDRRLKRRQTVNSHNVTL